MKLSEAANLARQLMNQHGAGHIPFKFDRAKTRLGACHWKRNKITRVIECKHITLSREITLLNEEECVRQTILHEIAHFLSGPGVNHSWKWRKIALSIGCDGKRTSATHKEPEARYKGRCLGCGKKFTMYRRPKGRRRCLTCGSSFYYVDTRTQTMVVGYKNDESQSNFARM